MPAPRVVPKIAFVNSRLLSRHAFPNLEVPPGVTAYELLPIPIGEMSRKRPEKVPAPAGLTELALNDVEAPGVAPASDPRTKPVRFSFGGGDILLDVSIAIYIVDTYSRVPKVHQLITEHEYLHVRDGLTLATSTMASLVRDDEEMRRYWSGTVWEGSAFFDRLRKLWSDEADRLERIVDSGPTYESYRRQITSLLPRQ